jgi:hypothetical protein
VRQVAEVPKAVKGDSSPEYDVEEEPEWDVSIQLVLWLQRLLDRCDK